MRGGGANNKNSAPWNWLVFCGVLLILLAVLSVLTENRLSRARELMSNSLTNQGALIIRSLESASRASMRHGSTGQRVMMKVLVEEMIDHPGVLSLTLVGPGGWYVTASENPRDPVLALPKDMVALIAKGEPINLFDHGVLWVGRPFEPFRRFARQGRPLPEWACAPWEPPVAKEAIDADDHQRTDHGRGERGRDRQRELVQNCPPEQLPPPPEAAMAPIFPAGDSPGDRPLKAYALVRMSTEEFAKIARQDLRHALYLAGLIFLAAASSAAAMVMFARRRTAELERLRREMAQSQHMAAVGRLAASVAHEIRNPLSALRGLVQFLVKDQPKDSRQAEYGKVAVEEVDRLERVVSGLLEYARPKEPRRVTMDLAESAESTLALMHDDPRAQGVRITVSAADDLPLIQADPDQIRQLILNLVVNALEALDGRGHLDLRLRREGKFLVLEAADDGPGLPDDVGEELFNPFFSTKERGSGLGLAIARRIAQAHGGQLFASRSDLGGASLTLRLPISTEAAS